MTTSRAIFAPLFLIATAFAAAQTSVTTYHNDNFRTGLNNTEKILTPANVSGPNFGMLNSLPVDGYVYAQPLYLPNLAIPGKGVHNVVFVATQHNSLYAFDANLPQGSVQSALWHINLGPSVPNWDTGSGDITPEIGITGTPVIVPPTSGSGTPTIYVVAKTKTLDTNGNPVYKLKLHAFDTATGQPRTGSPTVIQGSVKGTGEGTDGNGNVPFQPLIQHQRPALLYVPPIGGATAGTIYVGFASHGDNGPYHGWIFGYNASNLSLTGILNTTPNAHNDPSGYPIAAGGIWQAGGGLAWDGNSIFCATGNGWFDPPTGAYGDAIIKVNPTTLAVTDFFSPSNQMDLDDEDGDLGSGASVLLPPSAGSAAHPNLLIASGKQGTIYLIDRSNMGKFNSKDQIVSELPDVIGGIWGSPAYYNGSIYYGPIFGPIMSLPLSNAQFQAATPTSWTPEFYRYPGPTPAISANGTTNGILWAIQSDAAGSSGPAILHAYDASNLGSELYSTSNTQGRDTLGPAVKFTVPTIADGRVFVGTGNSLAIFGVGKWTANPQISPGDGPASGAIQVSMTDATPGAVTYYTTDGSTPTPASTRYTSGFTVTTGVTILARSYAPDYGPSQVSVRNLQPFATIGIGTGLPGFYYNANQKAAGAPSAKRVDPTINFNWGGTPPITGLIGVNWSANWAGQVQAENTGTYTFYTNSDDGVRLWVNGQLLIDNWPDHGPTVDQATIGLVAGLKYSILVQYHQDGGGSLLSLSWSAPGLPMQIVPKTQLYGIVDGSHGAPQQ